ncbi:MAG: LysR family transcriptional regulator [Lachnospiraceae bacterium]|nr:LysR family transcriptional regulator [Lachnospiraceae bacterium]
MYLRELHTFITVADQGSFLKAAQELYTTPASVMNQMNKLERIIGAKLLLRTNQGTDLTPAGHSIYQAAKQMIDFAEDAMRKAQLLGSSEQAQIRIGTSILRPCKHLIDLWNGIDTSALPFQLCIVPFDDDPVSFASVFSATGSRIDCFVGSCDSIEWQTKYQILPLGKIPCRIAVPRKHSLAKKEKLCWPDLDGENFMIVKRGDSPVLNRMWDDILANHPRIKIIDVPNRYDTSTFNECEQMNYLMVTMDIWADIHPSLITLPMEWDYETPYGIIYKKEASKSVMEFIEIIRNTASLKPL